MGRFSVLVSVAYALAEVWGAISPDASHRRPLCQPEAADPASFLESPAYRIHLEGSQPHAHWHPSEHKKKDWAAQAPNTGVRLGFQRAGKPQASTGRGPEQAVSYFRKEEIVAPDSKPGQAPRTFLSLRKCKVTEVALFFLRGQDSSLVPRPGVGRQRQLSLGRVLSSLPERKAGGERLSGEVK